MTQREDSPVIQAFLEAQRHQGFCGQVALRICALDDPQAGAELCALNARQSFPSASTIKVPLLVRALQEAQAGCLDLQARVTLRASDRVPGSGVLHVLEEGLQPSWQDVLTLMTVVSDNTATNLVIDRLGQATFNAWLTEKGWTGTHLVGKLQLRPEAQNEAQRRGERNRTTAWDQADLLCRLARGELLDTTHTRLALDILARQQLRDIIGRSLPSGPDGEPLYRLASKSGELRGVHHDVGVLFTPRPLVVALLSQGGEDPREHPENRDLIRLSRALWPLLSQLGQVPPAGDI
ncbi:serine hydrolase [Deinococcus navajonensis]|uniref:Serine hydrolase n=1 Tax=Deinococcus navajonensis TaxID=309884 RepID=A0ABV8XKY6_9DEIO